MPETDLLRVEPRKERSPGIGPDSDLVSDAELIRRSLAQDDSAYRRLVEKYQDQVAATVIGMLGPGPEADDVGQETFIRLYRSLGSIRGDSALGTYLTRIAINLSLDVLRRQKRRRFWFRLDRDDDVLPEALTADDSHAAEDRERRDGVNKAICSLEPKHRAVVVLRMISGYSTRETAAMLGIPQGTVLSRLARAQDKLRILLRPLIEE